MIVGAQSSKHVRRGSTHILFMSNQLEGKKSKCYWPIAYFRRCRDLLRIPLWSIIINLRDILYISHTSVSVKLVRASFITTFSRQTISVANWRTPFDKKKSNIADFRFRQMTSRDFLTKYSRLINVFPNWILHFDEKNRTQCMLWKMTRGEEKKKKKYVIGNE